MPRSSKTSLWNELSAPRNRSNSFLCSQQTRFDLGELARGSSLADGPSPLRGRSVLVAARNQLIAALALIELDGIAGRLVLCPPDLPPQHLPFVLEAAGVDAIVSDGSIPLPKTDRVTSFITCSPRIVPADCDRRLACQTEWILLTSGTTGRPKLVVHTLASLAAAIKPTGAAANASVWSTFYDIRRYGGLQIFLRAILTGASLVLSSLEESVADFLVRAGACGVTHISGTPSHWRGVLMSPSAHRIAPRYIRLSGEISDQTVLDQLHSLYPHAGIAHAFASTEAGVAFDVNDGLAGFPATLLGASGEVEMKIEEGSLRIRSQRTATHYIGLQNPIRNLEAFVDTGDMVDRRGDRYYFVGRRDGVINVGGHKVHPEEIEAVLNQHPLVTMCLVRAKKSPITGALVVADIVLRDGSDAAGAQIDEVRNQILELCRNRLPRHKVPASINIVSTLAVAATGKLARQHA
jgi:acyl-coenzyme A synthetase/AMP-(fatty) acid ligase